jgi:flagellar basal-body rod protein FlgB
MNGLLDSYFETGALSIQAKNKRLELISENIANVSTPGYKARDLDFAKFMEQAQSGLDTARTTSSLHIGSSTEASFSSAITYYQPLNPSLDNNTVDIGVEQAKFGKAAADYEASVAFIENRISGLRRALKGE